MLPRHVGFGEVRRVWRRIAHLHPQATAGIVLDQQLHRLLRVGERVTNQLVDDEYGIGGTLGWRLAQETRSACRIDASPDTAARHAPCSQRNESTVTVHISTGAHSPCRLACAARTSERRPIAAGSPGGSDT